MEGMIMAAGNPVDAISFRFHHTMLLVADLDRAVDFYTRLLGMTVKERHANAARKTEVALLGYGNDPTAPFLELTAATDTAARTEVAPLNTHVAIDASDLRALCTVLENEGVRFLRAFKERSDGKGFSAWVADPDGNPLELAERHGA
jgi:lactoylglutathione lyase